MSSTIGTLVETIRYYHDGQDVLAEYTYDSTTQTETLARTYVNGTQGSANGDGASVW